MKLPFSTYSTFIPSSIVARIAITELPDKCLYSSDTPYDEPLSSKDLIEFISPSNEIANKVLGN
ncbi:hypothetical protein [uncultured Clostridium sp.]|uniref:hypothetical protein n=1 Tax=uncultured Clostridium sp. TaxID=59620 RepID=UPI00345B6D6B